MSGITQTLHPNRSPGSTSSASNATTAPARARYSFVPGVLQNTTLVPSSANVTGSRPASPRSSADPTDLHRGEQRHALRRVQHLEPIAVQRDIAVRRSFLVGAGGEIGPWVLFVESRRGQVE